jgi:CoA:oxalate CoA-transferase
VLGNVSVIDEAAGLALAYAILGALIRRDRTGEVDHVQVNLLDTAVYLQSAPLAEFSVTGQMREQTDYSTRFSTVGVFEAADGPVFLAAYFERDWERLCEVFERPDLAKDERFATAERRLANVVAVQAELRAEFARRPRAHWLDVLERSGVMVGAFRSYGDVLAAPQVHANATLESLVISNGEAAFPRPPYRFPAREWVESRPSPALGSSTDEVLGGLGLGAAEIAGLRAQGVLGGAS